MRKLPLLPLMHWVHLMAIISLGLFWSTSGHALPAIQTLTEAESALATRLDEPPPQAGWARVSLPDAGQQWPKHTGIVWYRIALPKATGDTQMALSLNYLNMAGSVYLNDQLIYQDVSRTEPLSRSWNAPKIWPIAKSLLQPEHNVVTIQVVGYAHAQVGMSELYYGPWADIKPHYDYESMLRRYIPFISSAISLTLFILFACIYLFKPHQKVHAWFALLCGCWTLLPLLFYITTPWLGLSSHAISLLASALTMASTVCFIFFVLSLLHAPFELKKGRIALLVLFSMATLVLSPYALFRPIFFMWLFLAFVASSHTVWVFIRQGKAHLEIGFYPLAIVMVLCHLGYAHDVLIYQGWLSSTIYVAAFSTNLLTLVVAGILILRFARNAKKLQALNHALEQTVVCAQERLALRLNQQHELARSHACLEERLNLVRDLHDGLGGTLVSHLAMVNDETQKNNQRLAVLQALQADMRLIIETATNDYHGEFYLADQLATFRHRITAALSRCNITTRWHIDEFPGLIQPSKDTLDILRFMQEALTNVMKHSQANEVRIQIKKNTTGLTITIKDNGHGFIQQHSQTHQGQGLSSMSMRATRLKGILDVQTDHQGTTINLIMPLPSDKD